jgi:TRAP-type C4-dicarboxylate transport system substrate-binding protein
MSRRILSFLYAVAVVAASVFGPARIGLAQTTELKMHSVLVKSRPEAIAMQEFADHVYETSGHKLKVNIHHGGALGIKDADLLRILPGESIDMAGLYAEYLVRDVPELAYVLVQGTLRTADEQLVVMPTIQEIYAQIYSKWGVRIIQAVQTPIRNVHIFCKEPVNTLAQLKGKKLRVWSKHQVQTFAKLGVPAQIIGQNDLYLAMQTGVVDCAVYPVSIAKTISLQEVAKNAAYLHPYAGVPFNIVISERAWKKLTPEHQKILTDSGEWIWNKTAKEFKESAAPAEIEAEKALAASGVKILPPFSQADRDAFTKAARDTWLELSKEVGDAALKNREKVLAALKETG